jgi:hypothetical protein
MFKRLRPAARRRPEPRPVRHQPDAMPRIRWYA